MVNVEKRRASQKRYYERNKHKKLAYTKRWEELHKEQRKEYQRAWRLNNNDWIKNWIKNNKEKLNPIWSRNCSKRRMLKYSSVGSHSVAEWNELKLKYNNTCPACLLREPEIKLTEDHVVPISKQGTDFIENIQPLCRSCNSRKNTRIIRYPLFNVLNIC